MHLFVLFHFHNDYIQISICLVRWSEFKLPTLPWSTVSFDNFHSKHVCVCVWCRLWLNIVASVIVFRLNKKILLNNKNRFLRHIGTATGTDTPQIKTIGQLKLFLFTFKFSFLFHFFFVCSRIPHTNVCSIIPQIECISYRE